MEDDLFVAGVVLGIVTIRRFRITSEVSSRFGTSERLKELGSGRRRLRDDIEFLVSPMRRHLPTARCRVISGADRLQQLLFGRYAQGKD